MLDPIRRLFDTSEFPARWHCGTWSELHGWTHIVADIAIFAAYAAIPIALVIFVTRRRDTPFLPIFWLFVAFILFCGITHLAEAIIFWNPWYRFSALLKVCTAIVSWATVLALIPVIPKALTLPGLAAANAQLEQQVAERRDAEARLQRSYSELEDFAQALSGREERMIELKGEVNALLVELGRDPRYASDTDAQNP